MTSGIVCCNRILLLVAFDYIFLVIKNYVESSSIYDFVFGFRFIYRTIFGIGNTIHGLLLNKHSKSAVQVVPEMVFDYSLLLDCCPW